MKKLSVILCLMLLLCGCVKTVAEPTLPVSTEPSVAVETIRQTEPPVILSHEIAMLEGYVVMDEGDVRHNAGNWVKFLDACENGDQAGVTVVQFQLGEAGYTYVKYDLSFDGKEYTLTYAKDGELISDSAPQLVYSAGKVDDAMEPYDSYERYSLNDVVIYEDLIAAPDFEGVSEIRLHAKEGEPPVMTYSGDALQPILELLWEAEYVPCEPENYAYGMKLLMTNRDGKELVIELELNQGYYRYGMQNYCYGEVPDLFTALGIDQWPDSVLAEFGEFVK